MDAAQEIAVENCKMFNEHQKDNRTRATQLINYGFLLAGGTFTTSVTLFSSRPKELITPRILCNLRLSWWFLFAALILFFSFVVVMIVRDYLYAELHWRPTMNQRSPKLGGRIESYFKWTTEPALFITGMLGFIALFVGLFFSVRSASIFLT